MVPLGTEALRIARGTMKSGTQAKTACCSEGAVDSDAGGRSRIVCGGGFKSMLNPAMSFCVLSQEFHTGQRAGPHLIMLPGAAGSPEGPSRAVFLFWTYFYCFLLKMPGL